MSVWFSYENPFAEGYIEKYRKRLCKRNLG